MWSRAAWDELYDAPDVPGVPKATPWIQGEASFAGAGGMGQPGANS